MSKVITSPIDRWKGTVTISTEPSWDQIDALEASFDVNLPDGKIWYSVIDRNKVPAVLAWVEKWDLQKFPEAPTESNFRVPRKDCHRLVDWIMGEIMKVYNGESEIPNE